MNAIPIAASLTLLCLFGCHSYQPAPVDLDAHFDAFRSRAPAFDHADGLRRADARELAKLLHPDARLARKRAGVATAERDQAGRWDDPQLQTNLQRVLENVPHRWIAMAQIGFTVPINGRLGKQRALADRRRDLALVTAWQTEQQVANDLDRAWIAWSAAGRRVELFAQTCQNLERLESIAERLVTAGSLTRPGARIFALERRERQAGRALAEAELHAAGLEVRRRIGLHPDADVPLLREPSLEPFVATPLARQSALRHGPRLRELDAAHETAEADLHLQIRLQYPDLQLWPGWQEEDAQPRAAFGVNLPLPLWNRNEPEIQRALAEREHTAEALRCGLEQVIQELAIAEVRRDAAGEQARRFAELLELAEEQLDDSRRLADAGQFDPLITLDALLRLHTVQMRTIDADEDHALATVTINELLADPASSAPPDDRTDRTDDTDRTDEGGPER